MQAAGIPTCGEMSYTDAQSFQLETVSHQKAKKKKKKQQYNSQTQKDGTVYSRDHSLFFLLIWRLCLYDKLWGTLKCPYGYVAGPAAVLQEHGCVLLVLH